MKVIERKPWAHEFTCKGCGSKLEAERQDVLYWEGHDMGGDFDNGYYVKCAVCGTDHTLSESRIPQDIKNEAHSRYSRGRSKD